MNKKSNSQRPSAGFMNRKTVVVPFKKSFFQGFLFTWFIIFGILVPTLLNMVFYDFKSLISVTSNYVSSIKKKGSLMHRLRELFRDRIYLNPWQAVGFVRASLLNDIVRTFKKGGTRISTSQMIILMSGMPSVTQVITAVLGEPDAYNLKGDWAEGRINNCTGNPKIVIPTLTITAYLGHLSTFRTAQLAMQSGLHTAKQVRDDAWIIVKHDILALMAVAQMNSNNDTLHGITIIESGGWTVKMVAAHEVHPFKAVNAGPGIMNVSDAGAHRNAIHDWEMSTDGVHWISYMSTHHAEMTASDLPQTSKVWFRTRARLEGMPIPDWDLIYVTVN